MYITTLLYDVYDLFDLGATLSFVTPLVARKYDILPDIQNDHFMVSTLVGESVVSKRVYRNCHKIFTYVELEELDMVDVDVILEMYWLHDSFSSIGCGKRIVMFNSPNEPV